MVRQIMEGRYDFDDDKWEEDRISQYAKDLISKILVLDTNRRLTVGQCLSHEFFFPLLRRNSNITDQLKHNHIRKLIIKIKFRRFVSIYVFIRKYLFDLNGKFACQLSP